MYIPLLPNPESDWMKRNIHGRTVIHNEIEQQCRIREFFKRQEEKPFWLRSSSCMISCDCPKCRVYCKV